MTDIADQSGQIDPVDPDGQVDPVDQQAAEPEPQVEPWDEFDNYADKHVQVLVDGEPQYVPLKDLRDGYQRQADYTRKTQALAEERKQLQQAEQLYRALDADPAGTLKLLQTAFADELQPQTPDPEDEFLTDEQRELRALREQLDSFVQSQTQQQVAAQLDAELNGLVSQHGLDEAGKQQLIEFAVDRNYDNFTDAFARMKFEGVIDSDTKAQSQEARQAAARQAQVVTAAGTRNSAASPSPQPRAGQSVRDSYEQALAQLSQ